MKNYNICPACGKSFFRPLSYTGPTCGKINCVGKYLKLQKENSYSSFMFNNIPEEEMNTKLKNRKLYAKRK